ncbi:MAG: protein jag [Oscillospiraceae bacterium]|nr:protein jag [Oscillospiraceae bacterium]
MLRSIETTAKTEDLAIASALEQLGKSREEVSVEILERSKSGFLGIGSTPARVRVSYEYIETPAEKAEAFLKGLLERMGSDAVPEVEDRGEDGLFIRLNGQKLGMLIGRHGETLDAIQHLTGYVVNRGVSKRTHISVDAEDYWAKREESMKSLAYKVAAKVIKYRKNMTLEPMNSYERHVIHTALQDYEEVSTYSVGSEPNRRVVVAYGKARRGDKKSAE